MIKPSAYQTLPQLAEKALPKWKKFLAKNKKRLEGMDLTVHALHYKYSDAIDCLQCARCCRELGPRIEDKDVERIAKALRIKSSEVLSNYFRTDEDGDRVFKSMPCPFLNDDNYCAIYEARPKACREYPHTDRKRFYQIYQLSMKNAETCPIVYEVLEELEVK
ncbi:MAG TPA: YkgJ family cysteine cluster protein [Bacteroidales bacterium]|nr:YkgJ family cysteine cluster protein [Bacteroidales bacterium]